MEVAVVFIIMVVATIFCLRIIVPKAIEGHKMKKKAWDEAKSELGKKDDADMLKSIFKKLAE